MRIFQVDAFTRTRFTGNPAVVVLDADGCAAETMAAIAREFAHAEVAFVSGATGPDHDVRLRFFNARKEVAFVGHATVAAHAVLLALGLRGAGVMRQHSALGVLSVRARCAADGAPLLEFRQTMPELAPPLPSELTLHVADALRLPASLLHPSLPVRLARKGGTRLLVPVGRAEGLETLAPEGARLLALGEALGADGFFVFFVRRDADSLSTESRMFCPALGIPEDPVSGNAHSMLAAYLWESGQFSPTMTCFVGHQGRWVRRPGVVAVELEIEAGRLTAAHVGGSAVIVSEGVLAP